MFLNSFEMADAGHKTISRSLAQEVLCWMCITIITSIPIDWPILKYLVCRIAIHEYSQFRLHIKIQTLARDNVCQTNMRSKLETIPIQQEQDINDFFIINEFLTTEKKSKSEKNWLLARKVVIGFKLCHDKNIMNEWSLHLQMWYVKFTRIIMYDWSLSVISGYEFVWISFRGRNSSKSAMIFANMMYYYSETAKNDKKADNPAKHKQNRCAKAMTNSDLLWILNGSQRQAHHHSNHRKRGRQ